jgi:hypothetical protein
MWVRHAHTHLSIIFWIGYRKINASFLTFAEFFLFLRHFVSAQLTDEGKRLKLLLKV